MKKIQDLQNNIQVKEMEVQELRRSLSKEGQQKNAARVSLEMVDKKTRIIALEEEIFSLRGATELSQAEASCYQHTIALLRATPTKVWVV